jgi:hypothetical protein
VQNPENYRWRYPISNKNTKPLLIKSYFNALLLIFTKWMFMKRIARILRRLFKESFSFHFLLRIGTNFKIGALDMFLCVCHLSNFQKYNQQLRSSFHQRYLKDWLNMGMIISRYTFSVSNWQMPRFVTLSFLENTTDVIPDVIRRAQHEDIQILKDNYNKLLEKHYKKARQKKLEDLDRFECKIARPELPEFSLDIENNSVWCKK